MSIFGRRVIHLLSERRYTLKGAFVVVRGKAQGHIASDFSWNSIDFTAFIVTGLVLSFIFHQYAHLAQQC